MNNSIIIASNLTKKFTEGKLYTAVLSKLDLTIHTAQMLAIVGPSGSGKSTLLHLLGGLDTPTTGTILINNTDINQLSEQQKAKLRNQYLGFVYQFHHLLPEFSALENVALPLLIGGHAVEYAKLKAKEILIRVGLAKRESHRTGELSGGERQRVAIARALVTNPKCVLADEPTGNLDQKTAQHIYEMIIELNQELQTAFVIVTHDLAIARKMQTTLVLEDGRFVKSS